MGLGRVFRDAVLLGSLFTGCKAAPRSDTDASRFVVADVIVSVTNESQREMQLYVGSGAREHSLGSVPAHSSRSFSLPSELGQASAALYFEARTRREATGSRSATFSIAPGQHVLWTVSDRGSGTVTKR